jgi:hypothetical protein
MICQIGSGLEYYVRCARKIGSYERGVASGYALSNKKAWSGWAESYLAEDEGAVDVAAFFGLLAHEAPGRRVALALLDVEAHEGPALLLVRRLDVRARVAALETQAHGKGIA